MPTRSPIYACAHCGQPHMTELECREHEAECPWGRDGLHHDPSVRACQSCGNLEREGGMFCSAKGGSLITTPVTLCRFWTRIPKPAPAGQAQAQGAPA